MTTSCREFPFWSLRHGEYKPTPPTCLSSPTSFFAHLPLWHGPGSGAPAASRQLQGRKKRSEGHFWGHLPILPHSRSSNLDCPALVAAALAPAIPPALATPGRPLGPARNTTCLPCFCCRSISGNSSSWSSTTRSGESMASTLPISCWLIRAKRAKFPSSASLSVSKDGNREVSAAPRS